MRLRANIWSFCKICTPHHTQYNKEFQAIFCCGIMLLCKIGSMVWLISKTLATLVVATIAHPRHHFLHQASSINNNNQELMTIEHEGPVQDPFKIRARSIQDPCTIRSRSVQDPFKIGSRSVQDPFKIRSRRSVQNPFKICFKSVQGPFNIRSRFRSKSVQCKIHSRFVQDPFKIHSESVSNLPNILHRSGKNRLTPDQHPTTTFPISRVLRNTRNCFV